MFKVFLHPNEKKAISFVLFAFLIGFSVVMISWIKKGYFEKTVSYRIRIKNGAGINEGMRIKISGLDCGFVDQISLDTDQHILLRLNVFAQFSSHVLTNSVALVTRKNFIGDKEVEIINSEQGLLAPKEQYSTAPMNQQTNQPLQENAFIEKVNEFDLLTIFKTDKMSAFFEDADSLKQNVQNIIQETAELLKSSSGLLRDSKKWIAALQGKNDPLDLLRNSVQLTKEINGILLEMKKSNPTYVQDLSNLAKNMNDLSTQMQILTPVLKEMGPELPRVSKRLVEALDESVILVKAMQKNYFIKDAVKKVKDQEDRKPASNP